MSKVSRISPNSRSALPFKPSALQSIDLTSLIFSLGIEFELQSQ